MSNIGKQSPWLSGVHTVQNTAQRDALYPSPDTNTVVRNLETGYQERYDGSAWQQEIQVVNANAQPVFNVKAAPFNARGDGVADDTVAIAAANAAANGAGVVYFPSGTYLVSSATTVVSGNGY